MSAVPDAQHERPPVWTTACPQMVSNIAILIACLLGAVPTNDVRPVPHWFLVFARLQHDDVRFGPRQRLAQRKLSVFEWIHPEVIAPTPQLYLIGGGWFDRDIVFVGISVFAEGADL